MHRIVEGVMCVHTGRPQKNDEKTNISAQNCFMKTTAQTIYFQLATKRTKNNRPSPAGCVRGKKMLLGGLLQFTRVSTLITGLDLIPKRTIDVVKRDLLT